MLAIKELLFDRNDERYVDERVHMCPADVEPVTVQSYLEQRLGQPLDVSWTSTEDLDRVAVGWTFAVPDDWPVEGDRSQCEVVAIPMLVDDTGELAGSALLALAEERRRMEQLAAETGAQFRVEHRSPKPYRRDQSGAATSGATRMLECLAEMTAAVDEIRDNLVYVAGELPSLEADAELIELTQSVCEGIQQSIHFDLRGELRTLGEKLQRDSESLDPGVNPDPRATLTLIKHWLASDLQQFHEVVEAVVARANSDADGLLSLLVIESGTNILKAGARVTAAADEIERILDGGQQGQDSSNES